jgi:Flp pilus assembly protein TadD
LAGRRGPCDDEKVIPEDNGALDGYRLAWKRMAAPVVLVFVSALPYLNSLQNGFVYDDDFQVVSNPYLRSFHFLRPIFTTSVWSFKGGAGGTTSYYRPLMSFGYLLLFQLFGPNPVVFHAANLLVHIGVVLLVYKLTEQIFPKLGLIAALVFALHPVHSESVDWVGAVTDLELTLFYLAAFYFYVRIPRASEPQLGFSRLRMQTAAVFCLAVAMLSKEQAVTLPVLATLYEHFYRHDRNETGIQEKLFRYLPLWLLVPVYLLVRSHFLGGLTAVISRPGLALDECMLSAAALFGQYVGKALWPARLCMYYVFPHNWSDLLPLLLGGIASTILCALLFVLLWKKARLVSFGLLWFIVTLIPVLNVRWMPEAAFAERYLYLPSVGLSWVLAWVFLSLWKMAGRQGRAWRAALALAAIPLAVLAVARVVTRNRDWKNETTLYQRTLAVSPDAYVIHTNLGKIYWEHGQSDLAEQEWQTAARLCPNVPVTLNNLALLLTSEHRYDEAVSDLKRSLQISPDDTMAHIDLGIAYDEMGRSQDAEQELRTAVRLSPLSVLARNRLGEIYNTEGRFADAEAQFRASLRIEPNLGAWLGLGLARWRQGDAREAEYAFKQAQASGPAEGRIHFLLAALYGSTGRKTQALQEYQAGLRVDPANSQAQAEFQKLQLETSNATSMAGPSNAQ